jgi:four helix bundle protein
MKDFRELQVWGKSHQLVLDVYRETRSFPKEEIYRITSQMRRAAYSTPSNIAEGCGKRTDADFGQFLQNGMGSANELDYFLLLSRDLQLLAPDVYDRMLPQVMEVKRMLASLLRKVCPDQ